MAKEYPENIRQMDDPLAYAITATIAMRKKFFGFLWWELNAMDAMANIGLWRG